MTPTSQMTPDPYIPPTSRPKVLAIGLDGLEISYAEQLMAAGQMPALAALKQRSAAFLLDHGAAQRTGLAWEQVASGRSPQDAQRWSAVEFNPSTYEVWQADGRFMPFWESLAIKTVVFDAPYSQFGQNPEVQGVVGWGAHDPGTGLAAQPASLLSELQQRFGNYPAPEWIYACPCHSADKCQQMGNALVNAVKIRQQAARWLLTERLPDWDFAFVVTGELHSAIEGLWHGVDPHHPLHQHPSATTAGDALFQLHQAVDELVAELVAIAGEDTTVVVFAMGGMGANQSDLPSMVLLPELLYRHTFGRSCLRPPKRWTEHLDQVPQLQPWEDWQRAMPFWFNPATTIQHFLKQMRSSTTNLAWQPAIHYQSDWSKMPAFALPSFYDGRIRVNLIEREHQGVVPISEYETTCNQIAAMVQQCRDARTGEPVVAAIERPQITHPHQLDSSDADLIIIWQGMPNALTHPDYGLIGPVPFRRTGGHTGPHGMALIADKTISPGFQGIQSSFNVVPTLIQLLGTNTSLPISGQPLPTCAHSLQVGQTP
jgi:predicted AlkP superfamily phosphohydrolase/phosphomutase